MCMLVFYDWLCAHVYFTKNATNLIFPFNSCVVFYGDNHRHRIDGDNYTWGDSDVISLLIYTSWFLPPYLVGKTLKIVCMRYRFYTGRTTLCWYKLMTRTLFKTSLIGFYLNIRINIRALARFSSIHYTIGLYTLCLKKTRH